MDDVTILYQGGSGGFVLFYYFLLSGRYETGLEGDYKELSKKQFPLYLMNNYQHWKEFEFRPDNSQCKKRTTSNPKLFLMCNPSSHDLTDYNLLISKNTYKILIYTDIKLQLRMSYEKQAYWFYKNNPSRPKHSTNYLGYMRDILRNSNSGFDPMLDEVKSKFLPNQTVRLEDFIHSKSVPGFDSPNCDQLNFLDHWINLQPQKALRLLNR